MNKELNKAAQCADLLLADIGEAHSKACDNNKFLATLLMDVWRDCDGVKRRLDELLALTEEGVQ